MARTCKRCGNEIPFLNLSEDQKLELFGLIIQDLKLFAVKKLIDEFSYSHKEAKVIIDHWNADFGKCIRCEFSELNEENIECPKCKSFNYNFKIRIPFNQTFCNELEFRLDFEQLKDEKLKGFWCDGISHIPNDIMSLSRSRIENDRKIVTKAWIGTDGQDEYEMTIIFGEESVKNYVSHLQLTQCIPEDNFMDWISIEPERRKILLRLK